MSIFFDSSNFEDIRTFNRMGIIRGVTTNPTIMFKDQGNCGLDGIKEQSIKIAKLIAPLPMSVEVFTNNKNEMIEQARLFSSWADNIIIKIPFHGPEGELENVEVVHELENKHDIRVNCTAMMSPQQCLTAAYAGATYVSIFCGRVNNMGYDSRISVEQTRKLLDTCGLKSKIIAASIREPINVIEWILAGAHIVTVTPEIMKKMLVHPYTKETVQMFLDDASKLMESK